MKMYRLFSMLRSMTGDRRGLASVEFTIVIATVGVAVIAGASLLAPPLHTYLLRIERAVLAAEVAYAQLPGSCPAPPPAPPG